MPFKKASPLCTDGDRGWSGHFFPGFPKETKAR